MNKAEELITCLEGEIANRDARIGELEATKLHGEMVKLRTDRDRLAAELKYTIAAYVTGNKPSGVVLPERASDAIEGPAGYDEGWNACLDEVARLNVAPVQQVSVPDKFCIGAWRDALEKIAKYAPQVNCAARTELERAGLIAVHALIAFSAPQLRPARGTQTASNAAQAAPAADAGHVFYGMDGNHP